MIKASWPGSWTLGWTVCCFITAATAAPCKSFLQAQRRYICCAATACRCETCQRCLDSFNDTLSVAPSTSAELIATAFRAACVNKGRASAGCDKVDKAVRGSYKGNLGRRVGGICRLLGECDAALTTNATCVLTSAGKSGQLSECTQEGVSAGEAVAGIGECSYCWESCTLAGHKKCVLTTAWKPAMQRLQDDAA